MDHTADVDDLPVGQGEWYAGDLHVHTTPHSADSTRNSLARLYQYARTYGLDYIGVTDHDNHVSGDVANNTWMDPSFVSDDQVTMLYGAEYTTGSGHACTFGSEPYDHGGLYTRFIGGDESIAPYAQHLGIHFSPAHPTTGNAWEFSFDYSQSIEVWKSQAFDQTNPDYQLWLKLTQGGQMIALRGGSDSHHGSYTDEEVPTLASVNAAVKALDEPPVGPTWPFERMFVYAGTPTTWVRARNREPSAILDALSSGRVVVTPHPALPPPELIVQVGKSLFGVGDNITTQDNQTIGFTFSLGHRGGGPGAGGAGVQSADDEPIVVELLRNGEPFATETADPRSGEASFSANVAAGERVFFHAFVRGPWRSFDGLPAARPASGYTGMTNPIYFNFPPRRAPRWAVPFEPPDGTLVGRWVFDRRVDVLTPDYSGYDHNLRFLVPMDVDSGIAEFTGGPIVGGFRQDSDAASTPAVLDTTGDFTVAAWVRPGRTSGLQVIASLDGRQMSGFALELLDGVFAFSMPDAEDPSQTQRIVSMVQGEVGRWYHVAVTRRSSDGRMALYVDGQPAATGSLAAAIDARSLFNLGRGKRDGSRADWFEGAMASVEAHSVALTDADIGALHARPVAFFASESYSGASLRLAEGEYSADELWGPDPRSPMSLIVPPGYEVELCEAGLAGCERFSGPRATLPALDMRGASVRVRASPLESAP